MIKVTRIIKIHTRNQASCKLAQQDFNLKAESNLQKPLEVVQFISFCQSQKTKKGRFQTKNDTVDVLTPKPNLGKENKRFFINKSLIITCFNC